MDIIANKEKIVEELESALENDRTKTNVLGITDLGLVEMTRKKVRRKLSSLVKMNCPYCHGSGYVYSLESMALNVKRRLECFVLSEKSDYFLIEVHPKVLKFITDRIDRNDCFVPHIEDKKFYIKAVNTFHIEDINIMTIANHKELEKHLDSTKVYC